MSSLITSVPDNLFFCFGLPKSGTTYLQNILNHHPDISCPSEHQFRFLYNGIEKMLDGYNNQLQSIDKRTADQGATLIEPNARLQIFKYTVLRIIQDSARNKPIMGANDNAIINNLEFYNKLFESPKLIVIFRNPIDAGISAWHHNCRLAKDEDQKHLDLMMQYGGFDGWLKQTSHWFNEAVQSYKLYRKKNKNILLIRYEDLTLTTKDQLVRIFSFLGASNDINIINTIIAATSFETMKTKSPARGFFRSGSTDFGVNETSDKLREEITEIASTSLEYLGYNLPEQKLLPLPR